MTEDALNTLAREMSALMAVLKEQNGKTISTEAFNRLVVDLATLVATLEERCPRQEGEIAKVRDDMDKAFSRIRQAEESLKESVVSLKLQQAKWHLFATLANAVLVGLVVKFFVG